MASRELDDCDGIYIENDDSLDEVDASQVFQRVSLEDIPYRICRNSKESGGWKKEKASRLRMVHKNWGDRLCSVVEKDAFYALFTTDRPLTKDIAKKLANQLLQRGKVQDGEALRWMTHHLLMAMPGLVEYEAVAKALAEKQAGDMEETSVLALERSVLCNPPRAYFEVTCSCNAVDQLHSDLVDAVLPFSSAFTFVELIVDPQAKPEPMSTIPTACVTMLFDGTNQRHAQRTLGYLSGPSWQPVTLTQEVLSDLDSGQCYFQNMLGGPAWGIKTGCPQAGVQVTVFVQNMAKFDEMVQFYQSILCVSPLSKILTDSNMCYRVFPLSVRGELMITYIPGLITQVASNILVCLVSDKDLSKLDMEAERWGEGRWLIQDPEGNRICVIKLLK